MLVVVVVVVGDLVPAVRDGLLVPLFVCVGAVTELVDDVVDAANGAIADPDAIDEPVDGAPSPVDRSGVVDPLGTALGAVGAEPESNARDEKSATMPKTDADPIPLCRSLIFISRHNLKVDRPPQAIGPEQLMLSCTRLGQNCTSFRASDRPGLRACAGTQSPFADPHCTATIASHPRAKRLGERAGEKMPDGVHDVPDRPGVRTSGQNDGPPCASLPQASDRRLGRSLLADTVLRGSTCGRDSSTVDLSDDHEGGRGAAR